MKIAVVIPAYKVKEAIVNLVNTIGPEVSQIIVVDDKCPQNSGKYLLEQELAENERLNVIFNSTNLGVGGAVMNGIRWIQNSSHQIDIIVKLDGDGQMNPEFIPQLILPILNGDSDYAKGNRFHSPDYVRQMPGLRLFGNGVLSFVNKIVSGYWNVMDPTNGFVAIHTNSLKDLELEKISQRYFFESDMLFRLSLQRAVVVDVPMPAKYEEEESSLNITNVILSFPTKYLTRFLKRLFYLYFLRDLNAGSLQLFFGLIFFIFGLAFGSYHWSLSINTGEIATTGTVMLAVIPLIFGFQLLLGFLYFDINNVPKRTYR